MRKNAIQGGRITKKEQCNRGSNRAIAELKQGKGAHGVPVVLKGILGD